MEFVKKQAEYFILGSEAVSVLYSSQYTYCSVCILKTHQFSVFRRIRAGKKALFRKYPVTVLMVRCLKGLSKLWRQVLRISISA
jgi:hypothetical protein